MGKTRDLFKKIRDTKGTFHAKMGSIKDINGLDPTEVENIKRWKKYTAVNLENFHFNPKERQCQRMLKLLHSCTHLILQARLQQYVNHQLPDVQADFRKGRGIRDQIANICWIIKKARAFQKNIYFCFIDYAKAFVCVDHNKMWKILKEMGIPEHLTCL